MGTSVTGDRAIMLSGNRFARYAGGLRRELWLVSAKPDSRRDYSDRPSR